MPGPWHRVRHWLHSRGHHRFCHVVPRRVQVGRDYGQQWLVGTDPNTGEEFKIDVTTYGGTPKYETRWFHA